jgi:hypothetical protein
MTPVSTKNELQTNLPMAESTMKATRNKKHKGDLPPSAFSESASATAAAAAGRATESTPIGSLQQAPERPPDLARTAAPAGCTGTGKKDSRLV